MRDATAVSAILLSLEIEEDPALFVLLASDGSINRMGTGAVDNTERDMFIGVVEQSVFEGLRSKITPELLGWCGQSLADPSPKGRICQLVIGLKDDAGAERTTNWRYGSDSQGPPPEVRSFVLAALEATQPWYEEQKKIVGAR